MAWMSSAFGEGLAQLRNIGDVGEHAQLDLAVVGGDKLGAGRGDEGGADLPALLGADGNVLQIGIGGGKPAGRRRSQGVTRVDAAGLGIDESAAARRCRSTSTWSVAAIPQDILARTRKSSLAARSSSRPARVLHCPVLVLRPPGSHMRSNRNSPSCFARAEVEVLAGEGVDLLLQGGGALCEGGQA